MIARMVRRPDQTFFKQRIRKQQRKANCSITPNPCTCRGDARSCGQSWSMRWGRKRKALDEHHGKLFVDTRVQPSMGQVSCRRPCLSPVLAEKTVNEKGERGPWKPASRLHSDPEENDALAIWQGASRRKAKENPQRAVIVAIGVWRRTTRQHRCHPLIPRWVGRKGKEQKPIRGAQREGGESGRDRHKRER